MNFLAELDFVWKITGSNKENQHIEIQIIRHNDFFIVAVPFRFFNSKKQRK